MTQTQPPQTPTPAERLALATVIRYEHGGGRIYVELPGGSRELIADLYREDMREYIVNALCAPAPTATPSIGPPGLVNAPGLTEEEREALLDGALALEYEASEDHNPKTKANAATLRALANRGRL